METTTLVWILLFPLLGTAVLALGRNRLSRRAIGTLGSAAVGAGFLVTLMSLVKTAGAGSEGALTQTLFTWGSTNVFTLDFGLLGDQISLWWLLVVTGVGFLIHVYSMGYMEEDPGVGRYFSELNYFVFAMSLLVLADNFVGMLIGWANVGLASFLLIGFWNRRPEAAGAARKAFLFNVIGEIGLILALCLIFNEFRSFKFDTVFASIGQADPGSLTAISLLLLVGVAAKSAQLPLHTWLPDAMQGPTPVSALMHAATMVTAGVYLVARAFPLFQGSEAAMQSVAVVGAYSASLFHFFTHAFFKALLFLGAGLVIHYLHGEQDIRKMGGLGRKIPFVYWTFLAGVLAISGAPPFAGFFSKDEILGAVLAEGHIVLWLIGVVSAGLTAFYMLRLFALVFAGEEYAGGSGEGHGEGHEGGPTMKLPVGVLAGLSVVAGLIAIPGVTAVPERFLSPVFEQYGHHGAHAAGFGWPVALILLVAAAGAMAGIKAFGPQGEGRRREVETAEEPASGVVANAFYIDELYQRGIGGLVTAVSSLVGSVLEPYVLDGAVNGIGAVMTRAGGGIRRLHSGYLRRYVLSVFAGLVVFLLYFILVPSP